MTLPVFAVPSRLRADSDRPWPTLPDDPEPDRWVVIVDGAKSSGGGR
ncbi:hypothetical protein [Candidatus Protofrankia californiensis]|nr:hypothetical protein [Candidatus Protofrankia californiensis]